MERDIGLDVSMKETAISIRQDGKKIWRIRARRGQNPLRRVRKFWFTCPGFQVRNA